MSKQFHEKPPLILRKIDETVEVYYVYGHYGACDKKNEFGCTQYVLLGFKLESEEKW